jgi:hypothetical protein
MLKLTAVMAFVGLALMGNVGQALAEFCLNMEAQNRLYLQITADTTTSLGSVQSVVGIRDEGGPTSPVTGTLFREPDLDTPRFRMTLANPTSTGVNLLYNVRIGLVSDLLGGRAFSGPFLVWQHGMPEPIASGTAFWVDCQTGNVIHF